MARKKVLMCRIMPYSTMLNRARMFRALGWEPYLVHEQPFANSKLLRDCARVFEEVWSQDVLLQDANSFHEFVRSKGFDLLYTIGPPDKANVHFANVACPWIHDLRDLFMLTDPHADDPAELAKVREDFARSEAQSTTCLNACDLVVFVTPWQREKALARTYPRGDAKASIWLPNVPFAIPPDIEPAPREGPIRWGYVGNMRAAWNDSPTHAGHVAAELERLGVEHEFHLWSFMHMQEQQQSEWFYSHDSLAQWDLLETIGTQLEYGILFPPTKSDGQNGKTGWPGKVGDYIAAGVTALVPQDFMIRHSLKRNGWGIAYDNMKDVARIIASRRKPQAPRKAAPYLAMPEFMSALESAVAYAGSEFKKRYVPPVVVPVDKEPLNIVVASDGNRYHAEEHIAPILGAPYSGVTQGQIDLNGYKDLYLLGVWANDEKSLAEYDKFLGRFERVVVHWAGSDVMRAATELDQDEARRVLSQPHIAHFGQHRGIADEVTGLFGLPCSVVNTPSRRVYAKPFPLPKQFAVSVYYPSFNREIYRLDLVDEVMARMRDTLFYVHRPQTSDAVPSLPKNAVWLGTVPEETYPEFLRQVSVLLRPTAHDGVSYAMVEHFCAGRNVVMTGEFPFVTTAEANAASIEEAINRLKRERKLNMAAVEYWRTYNDFGRFRNNVREVLEHAGKRTPETAPAREPAGVEG